MDDAERKRLSDDADAVRMLITRAKLNKKSTYDLRRKLHWIYAEMNKDAPRPPQTGEPNIVRPLPTVNG